MVRLYDWVLYLRLCGKVYLIGLVVIVCFCWVLMLRVCVGFAGGVFCWVLVYFNLFVALLFSIDYWLIVFMCLSCVWYLVWILCGLFWFLLCFDFWVCVLTSVFCELLFDKAAY